MSKPRIFIDGHAGTTGLRIRQWLAGREDILVSTLDDADRKSDPARKQAMSEADLTILCLPDAAAEASGRWADELGVRVLDASSAHRVADGWVYGLPELAPGQRDAIRDAQKVTNPGCYPSTFLALIRPLIDAGQLAADVPLSIHALSGYTGGGKSLIEKWESTASGLPGQPFESPYALDRIHKHMPEMQRYANLEHAPQFVPAVGPFACGMRVQVPIHASLLESGATAFSLWQTLSDRYAGEKFVEVAAFYGHEMAGAPLYGHEMAGAPPYGHEMAGAPPSGDAADFDEKTLDPTALNDTNHMRLHVSGNAQGHALLVGILDNLGKGASGVAIQNLNLMLGLAEEAGLPG